jgi:eukaryotic-like serine/threonine-protein kinase
MSADANRLLALAEAVADGSDVDWADAESSADALDVDLVRELRMLAAVADVHRRQPAVAAPGAGAGAGATMGRGAATTDPELPEVTWGPLRLIERLGAGSFGAVYRARDSRLARDVALKLLYAPPDTGSASSIIEEGRLLARARHPHVVSVFGADRFDDRIGIWMEFIEGRTLEEVLRQDGAFGAREAALIGIDLCGALAAVHAQGLVHRDVKAQNVMREDGGRVVLMDFGASEESALLVDKQTGTPVYMAPELFEGGRATPRSDIYSLGVLLFRLVTGEYPIEGRTLGDVQNAHRLGIRRYLRDVRPDLPAAFVNTIERALSREPARRFESGGAMERALAETLTAPSFAGHALAGHALAGHALAGQAIAEQAPQGQATTGQATTGQALGGHVITPASSARASTATPWLGRRALIGMAAAIVLMLTAAAIATVMLWRARTDAGAAAAGSDASAATGAVTAQGMRSLAIRPLANLTGNPDQAYFAAGLTDLLMAHFGSARALRVIAITGQSDIASIVRATGVDGVFEGSVQRSDGRVRVSARLVAAGSNAIVWGRTYEGSEREAFNLQSQIAADVMREIGVTLTGRESHQLTRTYTLGSEAQDAYLRGRYFLDALSRPDLKRARAEFERVIALEPLYAPAHAGLALTYLAMGAAGDLRPADTRALASAAANTAFNLDPMLAEAALAVADVRFRLDWDVPGAEKAFRHAIDLNPSYVFARCQYARFLAADGRPEEALRVAREALRIDPTSGDTHTVVGMALFYARRYDEAIAHYRSREDMGRVAVNVGLGRAYAALGRYQEAIAALTTALEQSGRDPSAYAELGRTYAAAGDIQRARAILKDLYAARGDASRGDASPTSRDAAAGRSGSYIAAQDLAYIHIALHEYETALDLLDEAIAAHASRLIFLPVDPRVDAIRDDPRFTSLIARLHHARQ